MKKRIVTIVTIVTIVLLASLAWAQNGDNPAFDSVTFPVFSLNPAPVPGASIAIVGAPGQATWYFWASANFQLGSVVSAIGSISNAPNTLSFSNYISILPNAYPPGVLTVDILATKTPNTPAGSCNCAIATGLTAGGVNFQSNSLAGYTVSILNPAAFNLVVRNEVTGTGAVSLLLRNAYTGALICNLSTGCGGGGGGGGVPGGTLGQSQFYASSTLFGGEAGDLVATAFPGADICAQITNAFASLPSTGGRVRVPAGDYVTCAGTSGIGISIAKNSIIMVGTGWCNQLAGVLCGSTTLNFAAGLTGIDITGESATVSDLNLVSADTGANTDDGIRNRGNPTTLKRISINGFGRNGVLTLGNVPLSGTNADSWDYEQMQSAHNFGDAYQWGAPCTDNHNGAGTLLTASVNGGWGFNFLCGLANKLQNPLVQDNALGGYHFGSGGSYNIVDNAYAEGGTGSSFIIDSGVCNIRATMSAWGGPQTITNGGGDCNQITYFGPDNWTGLSNLWLLGQPGVATNHSYNFNVGNFASGDLGIYDYTAGAWLFHYDPTTKWHFDQDVQVPNLTISGTCTGCAMTPLFSDFNTLSSYTIPSSDAGKLVEVNNNSSPVSWTGPSLAGSPAFWVSDVGNQKVTYTPSSGFVNGTTTATLPSNWFGLEESDGVNSAFFVWPTLPAFPSCPDSSGNHLNFVPSAAIPITCGTSIPPSGGGTVTHTAGPLTAGKIGIGNSAADLTVDANASLDGSGNFGAATMGTPNGAVNSGITIVQILPGAFSDLSACIPGVDSAFAYIVDSTTGTYGATVTGGGTTHTFVHCNGTNWVVGL